MEPVGLGLATGDLEFRTELFREREKKNSPHQNQRPARQLKLEWLFRRLARLFVLSLFALGRRFMLEQKITFTQKTKTRNRRLTL